MQGAGVDVVAQAGAFVRRMYPEGRVNINVDSGMLDEYQMCLTVEQECQESANLEFLDTEVVWDRIFGEFLTYGDLSLQQRRAIIMRILTHLEMPFLEECYEKTFFLVPTLDYF